MSKRLWRGAQCNERGSRAATDGMPRTVQLEDSADSTKGVREDLAIERVDCAQGCLEIIQPSVNKGGGLPPAHSTVTFGRADTKPATFDIGGGNGRCFKDAKQKDV